MTQIIAFAGKARSGKDSSLKVIYGEILKKNKTIKKYFIDDNGDLFVNAQFENGQEMAILDISQRNEAFVNFAYEMIWPYVKDYHFADNLKIIASKFYGIEYEQMFGTTEQKTSPTKYKWEDIAKLLPKNKKNKKSEGSEFLTAREFLQNLGDVMRTINDDCFSDALIQEIQRDKSPIALIGDVRRIKEVEAIKAVGGKVIYLTRQLDNKDTHNTETEFDNYDITNFDFVIDNKEMNMTDKNKEVLRIGKEIGVI